MSKNTDPRWLTKAREYIGLREIRGPKHNPTIIRWLERLNAWWRDDETPWCGVFTAAVMQEVGLPYPKLYMRASVWKDYGANLRASHVAPGAILVFTRNGGGHVGFYVGEDATHYHVLGGNQSDMVNVMRIAKARCTAIRWPRGEPVLGGPVHLKPSGVRVSTNER
jgi:uncharacterized protein (TIGR02594 family)